jgi:hypothetical protein
VLKGIGVMGLVFSVLLLSPESVFYSLNQSYGKHSSQNDTKLSLKITSASATGLKSFSFNPDVVQVSNNGTKKCMNKCHWHYVVCTTSSAKKTCRGTYKKCVKKAARRCQN